MVSGLIFYFCNITDPQDPLKNFIQEICTFEVNKIGERKLYEHSRNIRSGNIRSGNTRSGKTRTPIHS